MKAFYNAVLVLCSILLIIIMFTTVAGVFFRYVVGSPLIWSDELARFALIWMVFLGAGVVSFKDKQLFVDFIYEYTGPKMTNFLKTFSAFIVLAFLIVLVVFSIDLLRVAGYNTSPALDIPYSFWRGSVVAGSILMIVAIIYNQFLKMKEWKGDK
ncbi:TRAP transporter small permease [Lacicoccus qingdaonensis]|uniref:TRAP-type C4-dicarboxylate transport system, small permease component n=1 Tax=Lacicoccus qingdaonensis TaxID=576118 RepID=A0A1G9G6R2_9BACL|nr:TRAP transporter small permease [Salinicoccus qingdaonensis]SDK96359.1 TRAP-type C4-dicarboxylate transport system, small permease component [Salinicoccus qingdaonensis]